MALSLCDLSRLTVSPKQISPVFTGAQRKKKEIETKNTKAIEILRGMRLAHTRQSANSINSPAPYKHEMSPHRLLPD